MTIIKNNYELAVKNIPEIFCNNYKLFIDVFINSSKYIALIDSGSTNTLMTSNIINNEQLDYLVDMNFNNNINTLNCEIDTIGRIWYLNIQLNNKNYNIDAIISPLIVNYLPYDIILGLDFLMINNIDILLTKNSLRINNLDILIN